MKQNGSDRAKSHGGDFTGVACLVFEDRIDDVLGEIKILRTKGYP